MNRELVLVLTGMFSALGALVLLVLVAVTVHGIREIRGRRQHPAVLRLLSAAEVDALERDCQVGPYAADVPKDRQRHDDAMAASAARQIVVDAVRTRAQLAAGDRGVRLTSNERAERIMAGWKTPPQPLERMPGEAIDELNERLEQRFRNAR